MTSYNKINGVYAHYSYELATTVLRGDWGFEGVVITDWWMQHAVSPEFPALRDNAYRVRAGVDVLMPGNWKKTDKRCHSDGTLLETLGRSEGITLAELQRTAMRVLRLVLRLKKGSVPDAPCQDRENGYDCAQTRRKKSAYLTRIHFGGPCPLKLRDKSATIAKVSARRVPPGRHYILCRFSDTAVF